MSRQCFGGQDTMPRVKMMRHHENCPGNDESLPMPGGREQSHTRPIDIGSMPKDIQIMLSGVELQWIIEDRISSSNQRHERWEIERDRMLNGYADITDCRIGTSGRLYSICVLGSTTSRSIYLVKRPRTSKPRLLWPLKQSTICSASTAHSSRRVPL
jgi:hypothetical protein